MLKGFTAEEEAEAIWAAQKESWFEGDLSFLLDENQEGMNVELTESLSKFFVLECARRIGKSFFLCVLAVQQCLRQPKSRVLYAAPTAKDAYEIMAPLIEQILETAPFVVKFDRQRCKFIFPNGSQIKLFGCDNKAKANKGRGTAAHLVLIDEAGFIPVLDYVLHSIVAPQTLTTKGRVILASTPSEEPDHPFTALADKAEQEGTYLRRTIYDNPRIDDETRNKYIEDDAAILGMTVEEFKDSDVFKREFMALRVIDANLVVVGDDYNPARHLEIVERPQFYDGYEALDFGGVDPHACLFGYWDYETETLVIEDELLLRDGQNSEQIANAIKLKEAALWGIKGWDGTLRAARERENLPDWLKSAVTEQGPVQPYLRVCDNDIALATNMAQLHQLAFIPTQKDDKKFHVNAVRVMFRQGRIKIHPRCRNLDRHLRTTMWLSEKQRDYRRRKGEHGDLLDCLIYMVRNLRKTRNPRPVGYGIPSENVWIRPEAKKALSLLPPWTRQM